MAKALEIKVSGVDEAIRMLERYQKTFQTRVELFMKKLTDYGVEKATEEVLKMDAVFTGELVNSIHSTEIESNAERVIFAVEADSEHAIYVEMGTGIIGATTPYPGKLPAIYAQGKTIRKTADGRYGWYYLGGDGKWYFTEGMPSRPFMYHAATQMRHDIERIAREVFG